MVSSLAADPNNSQGVYVAVENGGLFRSGDGGQNWTHIEGGLGNLSILSVAVTGDSQTIYGGTRGDGIYKSVNGGGSWTQVSNGLPNRFFEIDDLIIGPLDNETVYAILDTRFYLYKTNDGGNSWIQIGGGLPLDQIRSFAIHPLNTQIVYAGTYQNGIYKSENGGIWFDPINGNLPSYIVHFSCIGIDPGNPLDPNDNDIIYAGTHDYGLYKAEDDGSDTWDWQFNPIGDLTVLYNFSIDALAMDPVDQSVIYAYVENVNLGIDPEPSREGIYRTSNAGIDWERVPFHEYPGTYRPVREIAVAPSDGNVVYVSTQGEGLFMTNDVTSVGLDDWVSIDNGLVDLPGYTVILDPWDRKVVYAGTSRGFYKTTNSGLSWERKGLEDTTVFALVSDPMNMSIMYAATDTGVHKTIDGGESWSVISSGYQFNCLAIGKDPLPPNNNIIYGGNAFGLGIYRAEDDGSISWEEKNNGLSDDEKYVHCLAIDPSDPSILYAGTGYIFMPGPETTGKVIKTLDGGDTWERKVDGLPPDEPVYSLVLDPFNPQILYAGTYVGFYASTDGGDTWVFKDGGLGQRYIRSLAIDPMDSKKVCAGTYDDGVFASIDGGENWAQIDQGLTGDLNKRIISLAMDIRDIDNPVVYAGTGCGVFKAYK